MKGRPISGRVVDSAGSPIADATVVAGRALFGTGSSASSSGGPRFPGSGSTKEVLPDEDGEFSLCVVGAADIALIAEHRTKGRSTTVRVPGSAQPAPTAVTVSTSWPPTTISSRRPCTAWDLAA